MNAVFGAVFQVFSQNLGMTWLNITHHCGPLKPNGLSKTERVYESLQTLNGFCNKIPPEE